MWGVGVWCLKIGAGKRGHYERGLFPFWVPIVDRGAIAAPPFLDGLAIRNANRGDSSESIRANRFAEKTNFHNVRAIRTNRLKPAIRNFLAPQSAIRKKRGSVWQP